MSSLDLWYFNLSAILPREFFDLLSTQEREKAEKISHSEAKRRFLAGRGLLRSVLREYEKTENLDIRINSFGRPFLASSIWVRDFNLTHAEDLVVLAIATHGRVGVDIELGETPEKVAWSQKEAALKYSGQATLDDGDLRSHVPFLDSFSLNLNDKIYSLSLAHDGPHKMEKLSLASWSARNTSLALAPVQNEKENLTHSVYLV